MKLTRTELTLLTDLKPYDPEDGPIWYQPQDLSSPLRAPTLKKLLKKKLVERRGPSRTAVYRGYCWRITTAGVEALRASEPKT